MQKFDRLRVAKAYEAVSDAIEREILSGGLEIGDPLPTETELAEQFGVNRHTVREGIRVLEQGGLVRREAGRRLFVARPDHRRLAPQASRALLMQQVSFRELWEVALNLELCAMDVLARVPGRGFLADLEENVRASERALARGESLTELDVAFHAILSDATGNRALQLAREPISQLLYPSLTRLFRHPKTRDRSPRRIVEAHRRICDALKADDLALAREWMRKHMADFRGGYEFAGLDLDGRVTSHDFD